MKAFKRIVVATDFTEISDAAIQAALDLARPLHAKVTLVHAYEIPVYGFPDGALVATSEIAARINEAAQSALDALVKRYSSAEVPVDAVLRVGPPHEEVHKVADDLDADLIAVGTHGRHGLARAILGSVAEHLMRTATRPVLAVHASKAA
jgi:nucleotide-binding universal stress UspA family protein